MLGVIISADRQLFLVIYFMALSLQAGVAPLKGCVLTGGVSQTLLNQVFVIFLLLLLF
jgi:hypothetical protein